MLLGCCDDVDDDSPDSSSSSVGFLFLEFESEEDLVLILLDEGDTIGWILDRDGRGEREREREKQRDVPSRLLHSSLPQDSRFSFPNSFL